MSKVCTTAIIAQISGVSQQSWQSSSAKAKLNFCWNFLMQNSSCLLIIVDRYRNFEYNFQARDVAGAIIITRPARAPHRHRRHLAYEQRQTNGRSPSTRWSTTATAALCSPNSCNPSTARRTFSSGGRCRSWNRWPTSASSSNSQSRRCTRRSSRPTPRSRSTSTTTREWRSLIASLISSLPIFRRTSSTGSESLYLTHYLFDRLASRRAS